MSVSRITRSLSVLIPRCRPLLQSKKVSRIARTSVGFQQKTLIPQILSTSSFCTSTDVQDELVYMKLAGVPFNATKEDIQEFLPGIDCDGVLWEENDGRFSGTVFVPVAEENVPIVLQKDREYIGARYVFVNQCSHTESQFLIPELIQMKKEVDSMMEQIQDGMTYITLGGIPFSSTRSDIMNFLEVPAEEILIGYGTDGRKSGLAYCLIRKEDLEEALKRHREYIADRFVTVNETPERILPQLKRARQI